MPGRKGFTLIEIMVVIAMITILSGVVIPNLLRARLSANETAAISALRLISSSCHTYYDTVFPNAHPIGLTTLSNITPPYIPQHLAEAKGPLINQLYYHGYYFDYIFISNDRFVVIAWPQQFGGSGSRNFFVDESTTIRFNTQSGLAPNPNSPGI